MRSSSYEFTESASISASEAEVRAADPLPDVPLVVVSAHPKSAPPGVSVEEADRIWLELQGQLAWLTARGRQVVTENSGHIIPLDRPDAVVEAVRQVVESVRAEWR